MRREPAWMGVVRRFALVVLLAFAAAGCRSDAEAPRTLRVGAIPDQSPESVKAQHWPVIQLVCAIVDVRCEWVALDTYQQVVDALGRGALDMAFVGGAVYARTKPVYGLEPLVNRDVDLNFTSVLVVRSAAPVHRLKELGGMRLLFGNRDSTSGHVMVRHFLRREGIEPERFFSRVGYADQHEATLAAVAAGQADAGVVNSALAQRALARGGRYEGQLRIVWESPAYVDYMWAVRPGLPRPLRDAITEAFLDLDRESPQHEAALRAEGAGGFVPANNADYDKLAEIVRSVEAP